LRALPASELDLPKNEYRLRTLRILEAEEPGGYAFDLVVDEGEESLESTVFPITFPAVFDRSGSAITTLSPDSLLTIVIDMVPC
jgi:hypothetical protein